MKFLEFLASPPAQEYFANGNNEWPAVPSVKLDNPALKAMTGGKDFKADKLEIEKIGANQAKVQMMLDKAGYK